MVGKPITGRSFGGCVRYLLDRKEAVVLEAEGVRSAGPRQVTADFDRQRKLNPNLGKAVGHTILSWSDKDLPKLNDAAMLRVAKEYMDYMGIRDTQFLVVKHTDRAHPHLHIVYNRIDNNGHTISDKNNYRHNVAVCRALTERYGFYLAEGKKEVKRERLRGADKVRYEIYDAVRHALRISPDWPAFEKRLAGKGIGLHFTFKGNGSEVQGISFSKGELSFKGSSVDRAFSFSKLDRKLGARIRPVAKQYKGRQPGREVPALDILPDMSSPDNQHDLTPGQLPGMEKMLDILFSDQHCYEAYDPFALAMKRKKRKRNVL